jgi:hypothetical protein
MHSETAGGDYVLYVRVEPNPRGGYPYLSTNLKGIAYLCTPKGEHIRFSLGGSMPRHLERDTTGQRIHLYMSHLPLLFARLTSDRKPHLEFYGTWGDRELILDDHKSISSQFLPDGTVNWGQSPNHSSAKEIVQATLKEGSYSEFEAACPAKAR